MQDYDRWGPWTGSRLNEIRPKRGRPSFLAIYTLCALAAIGLGLWLAAH